VKIIAFVKNILIRVCMGTRMWNPLFDKVHLMGRVVDPAGQRLQIVDRSLEGHISRLALVVVVLFDSVEIGNVHFGHVLISIEALGVGFVANQRWMTAVNHLENFSRRLGWRVNCQRL